MPLLQQLMSLLQQLTSLRRQLMPLLPQLMSLRRQLTSLRRQLMSLLQCLVALLRLRDVRPTVSLWLLLTLLHALLHSAVQHNMPLYSLYLMRLFTRTQHRTALLRPPHAPARGFLLCLVLLQQMLPLRSTIAHHSSTLLDSTTMQHVLRLLLLSTSLMLQFTAPQHLLSLMRLSTMTQRRTFTTACRPGCVLR